MDEQRELAGLLGGAIDVHLHGAPSIFERAANDIEIAQGALAWGVAGFVLKAHEGCTAARAQLANFAVPGARAVGSIVLNRFAGGLNPLAVEASVTMGARVVFLPTLHAANHIQYFGMPGFPNMQTALPPREVVGVRLLDERGEPLPELLEVIDVVKTADVALATGHVSLAESERVVAVARERGVSRVIVNHPDFGPSRIDVAAQERLIALGAYIEFPVNFLTALEGEVDPAELVARLRRLGSEHCLLASDLGQKRNGDPWRGLARGVAALLAAGLSENDLDRLLRHNPRQVLGL
ncbi:MAG: DUF6282 family protein [Chloroflexota bacterium]